MVEKDRAVEFAVHRLHVVRRVVPADNPRIFELVNVESEITISPLKTRAILQSAYASLPILVSKHRALRAAQLPLLLLCR